MRNNIIALLVITFISAAAFLPVFGPGLYGMHDDQQVARLFLFDQALKDGQLPPRWVTELGFGYGYPLFVFYPPFVYFLGEVVHLIGFNFIDSIKIIFALSILLSGYAMYFAAKDFFGKFSALIASAFYIFVPYRALDVYVRGALAEAFSFVFLPLIIWSTLKIKSDNSANFIFLNSIFLALLMITHNLIFLPFMLLYIIFCLLLSGYEKNKKNLIFKICLSTAIAAGLSSFFWLPSLIEKKHTIVDNLLIVNLANYSIHYVYPIQLWNWQWGFGGSTQGLMDGISFKLGKLHILVSALAFIFAVIASSKKTKNRRANLYIQFSIILFSLLLISAYMTTYLSAPIWDFVKPLAYLQFPWRFLIFCSLMSSLLAGAFIFFLRKAFFRLVAGILLIILVVAINIKLFIPQYYRDDLTDQKATSKDVINWDISNSSFEYIPKGVRLQQSNVGTNTVNISKEGIPQKKLTVQKGESYITVIKESSSHLSYKIESKTDATLKANIFDFPGWKVYLEGKEIQTSSDNDLKLITFDVPRGIKTIDIRFTNTATRYYANLVSFATLLTLIILIVKWPNRKIS